MAGTNSERMSSPQQIRRLQRTTRACCSGHRLKPCINRVLGCSFGSSSPSQCQIEWEKIFSAEKERRLDEIAEILINGTRTSECLRQASKSWVIAKRMGEKYVAHARTVIRADDSGNAVTSSLKNLGALSKAMASNQLGAALGAVHLAAELAQLV